MGGRTRPFRGESQTLLTLHLLAVEYGCRPHELLGEPDLPAWVALEFDLAAFREGIEEKQAAERRAGVKGKTAKMLRGLKVR